MTLSLTNEFTGGELVRFDDNSNFSVEATDQLSSNYSRVNWMGGIASGALYAFRALHLTRQRVVITDLVGRLRASDMEAIACGSAIAIANSPTENWRASSPRDGPSMRKLSQRWRRNPSRSTTASKNQRIWLGRSLQMGELKMAREAFRACLLSRSQVHSEASISPVKRLHEIEVNARARTLANRPRPPIRSFPRRRRR